MKTTVKEILVYLLLLFVAACGPESQKQENATVLLKQSVETEQASFEPQEYHIPNELKYIKQKFDFLYDKFRPIGWSADGKFAYIVEPADEACGCYFFSFFIQDMKSDKIVYQFDFNDEGAGESLSTVWDNSIDSIQAELNKYKIIQKKARLENRNFSVNQQKYEVSLKTETEANQDLMIELVKNVQVFLSKGGKSKSVCNRESESMDAIVNVSLPGVVASPFEERVAIVLQEERRGYEGPPNVLTFRLVGAALNAGF